MLIRILGVRPFAVIEQTAEPAAVEMSKHSHLRIKRDKNTVNITLYWLPGPIDAPPHELRMGHSGLLIYFLAVFWFLPWRTSTSPGNNAHAQFLNSISKSRKYPEPYPAGLRNLAGLLLEFQPAETARTSTTSEQSWRTVIAGNPGRLVTGDDC